MNIVITGLPRCQTSIIANELSKEFKLDKPKNLWSETHKFGENIDYWLYKDNSVYKLWPIHSKKYINILENLESNLIVSYTDDFPLFVAKFLRSHITKDWGIEQRVKEKISFKQHETEFNQLIPAIKEFQESLHNVFSNRTILLKSAFVNKGKVSIHIQSSFDPDVAKHLRSIVSDYKQETISNYIVEDAEEFYDHLHSKIRCMF